MRRPKCDSYSNNAALNTVRVSLRAAMATDFAQPARLETVLSIQS